MCRGITVFVVLVAIFLGSIIYIENDSPPPQRKLEPPINKKEETYIQSTLLFPCSGLKCEAFFYVPLGRKVLPPVIIMAHGFGAQKDFGLEKFALRFINAGYAVFMFDYRFFGGSEGEPRNLVSSSRQIEDWDSAIEYVITHLHTEVDINNIALWGTSFSGGHVIVIASKSPRKEHLKAVISQIPYMSPFSSLQSFLSFGVLPVLKTSFYSVVDIFRSWLGLSRYYLPIVPEKPDDISLLNTPSALLHYLDLIPKPYRAGWQNKAPAEISAKLVLYSPVSFERDLTVPTLLVAANNDDLCPADEVREMSKRNPKTIYKEFIGDHFSVYTQHFDENIKYQIEFLNQHIK